MLWLKEIHEQKIILSLKKEKKLFQSKVLGKSEHPLRDLKRNSCHEEGVEFEEGNITFKVEVVASAVVGVKAVEKKASLLNMMSFVKEEKVVEKEVIAEQTEEQVER